MTAADCRATLQRAGLRVTPAREAVIAAFMRERRALDARDLIRIAVDARGRPVKPATAYRVLRDLGRLGLARARPVRHGAARWRLASQRIERAATAIGCGRDAATEVRHDA